MDSITWAKKKGLIAPSAKPIIDTVAAVSVGVVDGQVLCDLSYEEDVRAETDMNVITTGRGLFVEVQGTAEAAPFSREELDSLLSVAVAATAELAELQREVLAESLDLA
jgi:ribonuclease PH